MEEEKTMEITPEEKAQTIEEIKPINSKKVLIWQCVSAVLAISLILFFILGNTGILTNNEAKKIAEDFINTNLVGGGMTAKIANISREDGLFKLQIELGGQQFVSYMTKDAKMLFPTVIDLTEQKEEEIKTPADTIKSDKPVVELFVMSHCPYGTQAEKGILPAVKQLGDKIDFSIKFVDYAMHGEKEINEETRQYCIQKYGEYYNYLNCFLDSGDYLKCIPLSGINSSLLNECMEATDKEFKITETYQDKSTWKGDFPQFPIYLEENKKYDVQGSPTLIINGKEVQSKRSPSEYLSVICSSFNSLPQECSAELSTSVPSAGFGSGTSTTEGGECG